MLVTDDHWHVVQEHVPDQTAAQRGAEVTLINGFARSLILTAIERGASVITANKQLLAQDGATLYTAAAEAGVDLYFEAAVAGAIPIIRPLRESLVGDELTAVMGIVNRTPDSFYAPARHADNEAAVARAVTNIGGDTIGMACDARRRSQVAALADGAEVAFFPPVTGG